MFSLLVALVVAAPAETTEQKSQASPEEQTTAVQTQVEAAANQELQPHLVRQTVSLVLRREATAETTQQRELAIRDLCTLYLALAHDEEMAMRERLRLKAKMYSRLIRIQTDLKHDIARRAKEQARLDRQAQASLTDSPGEAQTGGGGAVRDHGEELVELIQKTISPAHWDVNGGPGSIVYYPNLKVLVVRASGEAHGHVGGLFGAVRRAP